MWRSVDSATDAYQERFIAPGGHETERQNHYNIPDTLMTEDEAQSLIDQLREEVAAERALRQHNNENLQALDAAHNELLNERDKLADDVARLAYQARAMGLALTDEPDRYTASPLGLERTLELMGSWRPGVERWGLHQMCRVLREEIDRQRAFKKQYRGWHMSLYRRTRGALAAIPCYRVKDEGQCFGQDYPWAACCKLRVALLRGEPFPTEHCKDTGTIRLFEPAVGREPRKPVGCVRLVEPMHLPLDPQCVDHTP